MNENELRDKVALEKEAILERLVDRYDRSDSNTAFSELVEGCFDAGHQAAKTAWVPVENEPTEDQEYEVTKVIKLTNTPMVDILSWFNGEWWNRSITRKQSEQNVTEVIAWRETAAPYQPEEE